MIKIQLFISVDLFLFKTIIYVRMRKQPLLNT